MRTIIPFVTMKDILAKLPMASTISSNFYASDNIDPAITYKMSRSASYGIMYCTAGSFKIMMDSKEIIVKPGSFICFRPGDIYKLIEIKNYKGLVLAFNESFFISEDMTDLKVLETEFLKKGTEHLVQVKGKESINRILNVYVKTIFSTLKKEENPYRSKIIKSLLTALIYELLGFYTHRASEVSQSQAQKITVKKFEKLLETYYKVHHTVRFYADALCITPNYLTELLKDQTGKSASEIIHDKIIRESQLLLLSTRSSIEEVSQTLHFTDSGSFTRYFKQHSGLTPSNYRKCQQTG